MRQLPKHALNESRIYGVFRRRLCREARSFLQFGSSRGRGETEYNGEEGRLAEVVDEMVITVMSYYYPPLI